MEGLRCPGEVLARTDLDGMTSVAKDYFYALHTPKPCPPKWKAAQQDLLEEVKRHGLTRLDPKPEDVESGPFTEEEMQSLTSRMPNTAPGPDGIHYGFWKMLIKVLDGLQDGTPPPRTFWSVFADVTKDIALRGSSQEGFKDANISIHVKVHDSTRTKLQHSTTGGGSYSRGK